MAEAFLNELLRAENSVQPTSGERCIICFTECGTLCPETGIVEWEIRLPCHHSIGSRCIAKWLDPTDGANDCPLCRYIFFPAQPRPYLEHGVIEDEGLDRLVSREEDNVEDIGRPNSSDYSPTYWNQDLIYRARDIGGFDISGIVPTVLNHDLINREIRAMEEAGRRDANHHNAPGLQTVKDMCETYCRRITHSSRVTDISQHFAEKIFIACLLAGHSLPSIAAVSVYVSTHLTGMPRTPHSVSMTSGVDADVIKHLYGFVCPARVRAELFDGEMLALIERGDLETVLGFLPEA